MGYQPRGIFTHLTPSEKAYLLLHPHHIATIKSDADRALAAAQRLFPAELSNGRGDAFRHCYWSAMLARDIGPKNALRFTGAHEDFGSNPPGEKQMDLHNNGVGVGIGRANPKATDAILSNLSVKALNEGRLISRPTSITPGKYGY